jgi:enoyl-CoA hydratase/carnithine racemase
MSETVLFEVADDVALLTLNRPDRLNAWVPEMQTRYFDLLEECAARADVRTIVLTGAGRGFCAGADMQSLEQLAGGGNGDGAVGEHDPRPVTFPLSIPKPIIAAINGACAGIGLVQALMCDMRFAAEEAKITTAFARRGLIGEHGIAWVLPRLIGSARALDLLLSGRVILGHEAERMGVVNRAVAQETLLAETMTYARELAVHSSPASMATIKSQVYTDLERGLAESLAEADRLMLESFTAPDFSEGVASFVERREPRFAGLAG